MLNATLWPLLALLVHHAPAPDAAPPAAQPADSTESAEEVEEPASPADASDPPTASGAEDAPGAPEDATTQAPTRDGENDGVGTNETEAGGAGVSVTAAADASTVETSTDPASDTKPAPDAKPEPDEKKVDGPTFEPGVQAFLRGEGRINPDLGAVGAQDIGQVLTRIRLQARGAWGPVAVFAQVQDARTFGFEASTAANSANTDLHQGYLELAGGVEKASGWIRVGRQEVAYGTERIIGPLLWMPDARSFDAIRLHGESGKFYADAMYAILAPVRIVTATPPDPMDPPLTAESDGSQLATLQLGARVHQAFNAELLGLFIREDAKDEALAFDRRIGDVGPRLWGEPVKGLTYDAEAHVQFGTFNDRDHLAWAAAANVTYVHDLGKVKPGVGVGYAIASGEACTGDPSMGEPCGASKSEEFFNFYPTNHKFYGLVDLFGWRNMRDLEAQLILAVPKIVTMKANYHFFQLQEPEGRWSNAGGANVGTGWLPGNDDHNLGHEVDFLMVFKPWKPLMIQPGYGVFIPTGAGETIAGPDPQHFIYLWIVATI